MKKYIIYKLSGGLIHMLQQINNAVYISKKTNRLLIIDCFNGAFNNDFNKYFNIPDFYYKTNYDCLYMDKSVKEDLYVPFKNLYVDFKNSTYSILDKKLTLTPQEILSNNNKIIYFSYLKSSFTEKIPWYIKVNKDIVNDIAYNKIKEDYIGVHFRNTDTKNNLEDFIKKINDFHGICNLIYLSTDDANAFDKLNTLLHNQFKITQYTKPIDLNGKSIHYGNPNKDEVIMNALIDLYHLTYSKYFIPSINSAFSKRVLRLRIKDNLFYENNIKNELD